MKNKILSLPKREAMIAYSDADVMFRAFLIFKWTVRYLNFSAWYDNCEYYLNEEKVQFWNKWNFVEKKREVLQHVLQMQ
jgi:hypothetical protein